MKTAAVILGVGLAILWLWGLGSTYSTPWISWLDCAGAIFSFFLAGAAGSYGSDRIPAAGPVVLATCLAAIWIIGLSTAGAVWQNWWNFGFACAYAILASFGVRSTAVVPEAPTAETTNIRDRFRKSA